MSVTRPLLRFATIAAAFQLAAPAVAQLLEIQDDGAVIVHPGATVATAEGVTELRAAPVARRMHVAAIRPVKASAAAVPAGRLASLFASVSLASGVDQRLLHAVAWHESGFRQGVVSGRGAVGLMQLMPATARELGVDPFDAVQNVRGGARLLASLLRRYDGDLSLALAAYNAGPGAVARYGGVPPFAETQAYVARIGRMLAPALVSSR